MKGQLLKKAAALVLSALIVLGGLPLQPVADLFGDMAITASADSETSVKYIGENGKELTTTDYTLLTGSEPVNENGDIELPGGTYVVDGTVSYSKRLLFKGDVNLILKDDAKLNLNLPSPYSLGILCYVDNNYRTLTVYGQSEGTGEFNFSTTTSSTGISCFDYIQYGGKVKVITNISMSLYVEHDLMIYGGELTAESTDNFGLNTANGSMYFNGGKISATTAASYCPPLKVQNGSIYFNGSTVEVTTTSTNEYAEAIFCSNDVSFNDGVVTANGTLAINGTYYLNGGIVKADNYNKKPFVITGTYSSGTKLYTGNYDFETVTDWNQLIAELAGQKLVPAYRFTLPIQMELCKDSVLVNEMAQKGATIKFKKVFILLRLTTMLP